jgi:hypothetical protein
MNRRLTTLLSSVLALASSFARIAAAGPPLHEAIDRQIEAKLPAWKISHAADLADDEEFLRRLSLDLTGVVPTTAEVRAFTADPAPDKRTQLVDRLLASDEFARHMAVTFDVLLMERRADKHVASALWRDYLADSFRQNKPLDRLVSELLGSDGFDPKTRPAAKFILDREAAHDAVVRDVGRLFLGVDLQCAQCHDHPTVTDYHHAHYYGLHAFFAGTKLFRETDGTTGLQENVLREVTFASVFTPDVQQKTGPRLMDGPMMEVPTFKEGEEYVAKPTAKVRAVPKFSLRDALSKSLPRAETREFSRNMANRLWAHLMGRGLVHPLDMHHSENPPSHPELLTLLADELAATKFDMRRFLREVALSRAYQRSSLAPSGVAADEIPEESFAVANLKGLTAEQLFASVVRATGGEKMLEREIDAAVKESLKGAKAPPDEAALKKARDVERAKRIAEFVELFGAPAGTPDGEFQASITQSLYLANSPSIVAWLEPASDNLTGRLLKLTAPSEIADEAYLSVLARRAAPEEVRAVGEHLKSADDRARAIRQLVWSLLASAEFRLNH